MGEEEEKYGGVGRLGNKTSSRTRNRGWSLAFFQMPKMEPMETKQSILEDPSRGSKDTTYLPRSPLATSMHLSFSSDTITPTCKDKPPDKMTFSTSAQRCKKCFYSCIQNGQNRCTAGLVLPQMFSPDNTKRLSFQFICKRSSSITILCQCILFPQSLPAVWKC